MAFRTRFIFGANGLAFVMTGGLAVFTQRIMHVHTTRGRHTLAPMYNKAVKVILFINLNRLRKVRVSIVCGKQNYLSNGSHFSSN